MDEKLKSLLDGVLNNESLKNSIERALTDKIIETIKWDSGEFIKECIDNMFNDSFKVELQLELEKQKENYKQLILDIVKTQVDEIKDRLNLNISNWDLQKLFRESISFDS